MPQKVYEIKKENFTSLTQHMTDRLNNLKWASVFILPFWLQTWWEHFGEGYELLLFSVWREGTLVGIAPLKCKDESASLLGSPDVCDYLDFIILPGEEHFFFQVLLRTLEQDGIKKLELLSQRPEAVVFESYFLNNHFKGWSGSFKEENSTAEIALAASWESYLTTLPKKQRHEVRRKIRKLENESPGFSYRRVAGKDEVINFMPNFMELFLQNPEKQGFMTSQMENFFQQLIIAAANTKLVNFGLLDIDGRTVAAVLYFDYHDRIYLYNSGYDSEYRSLSVGLLTKIFCIRDSIERGKQVFDFLKGREIYKTRLGGKTIPIYQVTLGRCIAAKRG